MEFCIVITTVDAQREADTITEVLLKEHLGACIHHFPVQSHYHWKGKIETTTEIRIEIKTRAALFENVKKRLLSLHPYDVPEIIAIPVTNAHADYLDWIREETLEASR
jgi:periplasmic divalent cation tolerance protein